MRHEINLFQRLFSMKINICIHSTSLTHHKFSVNIVQLIHEKQFQQNSQKFFIYPDFVLISGNILLPLTVFEDPLLWRKCTAPHTLAGCGGGVRRYYMLARAGSRLCVCPFREVLWHALS